MLCRKAYWIVLTFLALMAGPVAAETVVPASQQQIQLSYASVVKKTSPAVVNIYTQKVVRKRVVSPFMDDPFFQHFFGHGLPHGMKRERLENSLGSGVIVREDGLIVTSNHVIDGADEITVVLSDRREFEARVLLADDRSDLALLQIDTKGEKMPILPIKDSDEVEVGDLVIAIGNPFGVGQTVTSGIVSAIARTSLDLNDINYYIQTDAAINPGNSGGALVSTDGRLIGINAAIYSKSGGYMGLGFAIPSNMVKAVMNGQSQTNKSLVRPWIGIEGQPVTAELARSLGLARPIGVLINKMHKESAAARAGLKVGDVIVSVDGKNVDDPAAFGYRIATRSIGETVDLIAVRAGNQKHISFKLMAPPESPARDETVLRGPHPLSGVKVANLSPAVIEQYGLRGVESGVVILDTERTQGYQLGFDQGDIILAINGEAVETVAELKKALSERAVGWQVTIRRDGAVLNMIVR